MGQPVRRWHAAAHSANTLVPAIAVATAITATREDHPAMRLRRPRPVAQKQVFLRSAGTCPICQEDTTFSSCEPWLRDNFLCDSCGSIPRERALFSVLEMLHPNWAELEIHESSPSDRGASARIARDCPRYSRSFFFPGIQPGQIHNGERCENLEALTLADGSIDVFITQDVLEHVFHPDLVFSEIARTLRPGGTHIFTVPITRYSLESRYRALLTDGDIEYVLEAQYHGNPIDGRGALVTVDWGWDICHHIFAASGLFTHVFQIDDLSRGIRAAHIEVLATMKPLAELGPRLDRPAGGSSQGRK